uniref:Uncharacterized protein n=1 Tax=Hucho hucho TaxID=62062 RepID=A0A4W5Q892_9TELE
RPATQTADGTEEYLLSSEPLLITSRLIPWRSTDEIYHYRIPRNHPESYHSFIWNNFFKHIDIKSGSIQILDDNAEKIKAAGGIDLFVGECIQPNLSVFGTGPNGNIAFNEPGSSLMSRTRVKTLAQDTILANACFFNRDQSKVPTMALTVGVATVMVRGSLPCGEELPVCRWPPQPTPIRLFSHNGVQFRTKHSGHGVCVCGLSFIFIKLTRPLDLKFLRTNCYIFS